VDWNTWGPPLLAAVIGAMGGTACLARLKGEPPSSSRRRAAELQAEKAAMMEQLRELEADRAGLPADSYQRERQALIAQAAEALRKLEELGVTAPPRHGLLLPLTALFAVGLGSAVALAWGFESEPPAEEPQQASATVANPHQQAASEAESVDLPEDLEGLNELTYQAILDGDLRTGMMAMERARKLAPEDPTVLTHLAILRLRVGMSDRALESFEAVLRTHPDHQRALLWSAYARGQMGERAAARQLLERVIALAPESSEGRTARDWLQELGEQDP